jgi:glutathione S-transferase
MSNLELYWGSGSQPSWRVLLALEVKKIPYQSKLLSFSEGEHKTPEFLAMNPRHKVPTIKHGDYALYESMAILRYLDAKFPETPLFGRSAEEAGLVERFVAEFVNYLEPVMHERIVRPLFFSKTKSEPQAALLRAAIPVLHEELARLEGALADREWFVGSHISAADIVPFPTFKALERAARKPEAADFELSVDPLSERYPALARWVSRIEALPGYDKTFPPHWRD